MGNGLLKWVTPYNSPTSTHFHEENPFMARTSTSIPSINSDLFEPNLSYGVVRGTSLACNSGIRVARTNATSYSEPTQTVGSLRISRIKTNICELSLASGHSRAVQRIAQCRTRYKKKSYFTRETLYWIESEYAVKCSGPPTISSYGPKLKLRVRAHNSQLGPNRLSRNQIRIHHQISGQETRT